jgi:hypothetical protein
MGRKRGNDTTIAGLTTTLSLQAIDEAKGSAVDQFFQLVLRQNWKQVTKWMSHHSKRDLRHPLYFQGATGTSGAVSSSTLGVASSSTSATAGIFYHGSGVPPVGRVYLYPLHALCMQHELPSKILMKLLCDDPKAAERQDTVSGAYPLHYACRYGCSETVLRWLLASYPEAARKKNNDGCLPLHLLCRCSTNSLNHCNTSPNRRSHGGNAEAKDQQDDVDTVNTDGGSPFLVDKVKVLLQAFPDAFYLLTDKTNQTPLEIAQARHRDRPNAGKASAQLRALVCYLQGKHQSGNASVSAGGVISATGTPMCLSYKQCVICQSRDADHVLVPCGHVSLCVDCSTDDCLSGMRGKCPECREKFYCCQRIYGKVVQE